MLLGTFSRFVGSFLTSLLFQLKMILAAPAFVSILLFVRSIGLLMLLLPIAWLTSACFLLFLVHIDVLDTSVRFLQLLVLASNQHIDLLVLPIILSLIFGIFLILAVFL